MLCDATTALTFALVVLVSGCQDATDDPITTARAEISAKPRDPAPRIALARLYLSQSRGDLAVVLLDQAIQRGANPEDLLPDRADALQIAGETAELFALPVPERPTSARVRVLAARAKAAPSDDAYEDVYEALDATDEANVRAWVDKEPTAARARAHHVCTRASAADVFTWDQPPPGDNEPAPSIQDSGRPQTRIRVSTVAALRKAAESAPDGATVEVAPGTYPGAVAVWKQSNLTVRGSGDRPHISAAGRSVEDRDAWLFTGNNVTVENIEISGAHATRDKNGAAIRFVGRNLTLRHVYLHDSEDGLLTGNANPDSQILIEYSEFARNGDGEGYAHNLYVGVAREVVMRYSYSHEAVGGHLFKSRAARSTIAYNFLADLDAGTSSRSIDIPDGGDAIVIGNVIDQGANSVNKDILGFGSEQTRYALNGLVVENNTFYNRYPNALAIDNRSAVEARVINNVFAGAPILSIEGKAKLEGNLHRTNHGLHDPHDGDYSLTADSASVDAGADPLSLGVENPIREYVHPVSARVRQQVWKVDAGAYERCGM